jgi:hypothetical protein
VEHCLQSSVRADANFAALVSSVIKCMEGMQHGMSVSNAMYAPARGRMC